MKVCYRNRNNVTHTPRNTVARREDGNAHRSMPRPRRDCPKDGESGVRESPEPVLQEYYISLGRQLPGSECVRESLVTYLPWYGTCYKNWSDPYIQARPADILVTCCIKGTVPTSPPPHTHNVWIMYWSPRSMGYWTAGLLTATFFTTFMTQPYTFPSQSS
ncbi:hypothetical protein J6590_071138 [Homalodisca vitripennis]|nr:hypothetical protein J6590_071138 [Homalodisca vitripennis]